MQKALVGSKVQFTRIVVYHELLTDCRYDIIVDCVLEAILREDDGNTAIWHQRFPREFRIHPLQ
jgi:hypothetical protein